MKHLPVSFSSLASCGVLFFLLAAGVYAGTYTPQNSNRVTINLDTGWLYLNNNNADYSATTAGEGSFVKICVPHANTLIKHAYEAETAARIVTWYRRHFNPPSSYSGRRFLLEFQGVSVDAAVYVNGVQVDANGPASGLIHQGAYTPFTIDITGNVTAGQDNVIAVQVDSRVQSGVPPEGSTIDFFIFGGIVRHVNLIVTDPLHVDWTFVSTTNTKTQTAPTSPTITAQTRIVNNNATQKTCTVITNIVDNTNNIVASASTQQNVPANGNLTFNQTTGAVSNPGLWSIDHPNLYTVFIQVQDGPTYVDEYRTRMGIRTLTMNKTDGRVYLNGQAVKLRGLDRHETFPYFGRAAAKRVQRKDADILKYDLGCNIVRTSHYPQAPDFLDRCDEIGLLALEEIPGWMYVGNDAWKAIEMQTLKDMIVRDRNHPSIFTWGVRINESADDNVFYQTTNDTARAYDPTRLTCGVRRSNSDPATSFLEDIWTQNFLVPASSAPNMPVITTEYIGHTYPVSSYSMEDSLLTQMTLHAAGHNASYSESSWGGLLGWCAFDYASPHTNATTLTGGRYLSPHGVADEFRIPKLSGYFYQSQRDPALYGPMVYILNYWESNSPVSPLYAVSNCEQVELFVNGVSKGKVAPGSYQSLPHPVFSWSGIIYASGNLRVDGYIGGAKVVSQTWYTPGKPTKLVMIPDTSTLYTGGDMTRVVVVAQDANNQFVPRDSTPVTLSVSGVGDFIGETPIKLEDAKTCFYVKTRAGATGTITCGATASNLTPASLTLTVVKDPGLVPIVRENAPNAFFARADNAVRVTIAQATFAAPQWVGKNAAVAIYDLSGRLLYKNILTHGFIDFEKIGLSRGAYIVYLSGNPHQDAGR